MLPIIANEVRPWFEAYGATLDDPHSFRIMIARAESDIAALTRLMPQYRKHASDVAAECDAELSAAEVLLAMMRARLNAILRT